MRRIMGGFMQRIVSASRNDNGSVGGGREYVPAKPSTPTLAVKERVDVEETETQEQAEVLTCEDCGHTWPAIVTYYQSPTEFPTVNPGTCPECDGAPTDD